MSLVVYPHARWELLQATWVSLSLFVVVCLVGWLGFLFFCFFVLFIS